MRQRARELCSQLRGPEERLRAREDFYARYGFGEGAGYGRSELEFLAWESARGVLAPLDAERPGSPWWRAVNAQLVESCAVARELFELGRARAQGLRPDEERWLAYLRAPSAVTWYRAHNASILRGYAEHRELARLESPEERVFLNLVLFRLLYAQALVEGATFLGPLGKLGANPKGLAVGELVELPSFYPRSYPLDDEAYRALVGEVPGLGDLAAKLLDDALVMPSIGRLYAAAARWNGLPELSQYLDRGRPIYPERAGQLERAPTRQQGPVRPRKIAILGGGIGALAAAWELSSYDGWQDAYEITVYQLGHRLGGKMSGGRGAHGRIEELGLHLLLGFYTNAFPLYRDAYRERDERGLAPESRFRTLEDAIEPNHATLLVGYDRERGAWRNWPLVFPPSPGYPGDGPPPTTWELIERGCTILLDTLLGSPFAAELDELVRDVIDLRAWSTAREEPPVQSKIAGHFEALFDRAKATLDASVRVAASQLAERVGLGVEELRALAGKRDHQGAAMLRFFARVFDVALGWLDRELGEHVDPFSPLGRIWMLFDFGLAVLKGLLADVWDPGRDRFCYRRINHLDFRAWLAEHGAQPTTLASPIVTFFYTGTFEVLVDEAQRGGRLAAGTALQFFLPAIGYKGAFCWQLKLGTADTLIMPLYQVLRDRGVRFEFFHRVTSLRCDDTDRIERIGVERQVRLRDGDEYDPIRWVGGEPCWSTTPDLEQLHPEDAERIARDGIDLESPWSGWEGEALELRRGVDFDEVVLGMPPGALRHVAEELFERRPAWRAMVDGIRTAIVMSAQLWMRPTMEQLGYRSADWGMPREHALANVVTYANPLFSWLDQTPLLATEAWPEERRPGSFVMLTGVLPDSGEPVPPPGKSDYPTRELARAKAMSTQWLLDNMGWFFPKAAPLAYPRGLDFGVLVGLERDDVPGRQKLDEQFFVAAVAPTNRYVIAAPGTERFRLRPDRSGFENLVLVGDWTDYGVNIGYMEGCVVSAHQAVRALLGRLGFSNFRPFFDDPLADRAWQGG